MKTLSLDDVGCKKSFEGMEVVAKFPLDEMRELYSLGYHLIPCGGDDGKRPLRRGWNKRDSRRLPLDAVVKTMRSANSCTYGIRLDRLAVVDCDTWNEKTQELLRSHIQPPKLRVRTSRGAHLYFQSGDAVPQNFKADSVQIDFKSGHNHFVVGPGSIRPNGSAYDIEDGSLLPVAELSRFHLKKPLPALQRDAQPRQDRGDISANVVPTQAFTGTLVKVGERNQAAFSKACNLAHEIDNPDKLTEALALWVQVHCEDPNSFGLKEISRACASALKYRREGILLGGKNSDIRVPRPGFSLIKDRAGSLAGNTLLLYAYLQASHSYGANKPFAIVCHAIAKSGSLPLSSSTIDRCKAELRRLKLIQLLRKGRHMEPDLFVLTPISQIAQ